MNKAFLSIAALVLLALAVGALPAPEAVAPVQTTEPTASTNQPGRDHTYSTNPEKWSMLDQDERLQIIDNIEREVGSAVGPIYIALGTVDSPYRSTQNETYLFDTYGLRLPRSPLPYVLLCPAVSSNPGDLPPPFQYRPLNNVHIGSYLVRSEGTTEPLKVMPAQLETETPDERIPAFTFYYGVPVLVPKALGKIPIKMSFINQMIGLRELDQ